MVPGALAEGPYDRRIADLTFISREVPGTDRQSQNNLAERNNKFGGPEIDEDHVPAGPDVRNGHVDGVTLNEFTR